jgi:DNA-binding beta-propeller fold protein YncE
MYLWLLPLFVKAQNYFIYVAAESEDEVAVVQFDGKRGSVIHTISVGYQITEIEGPHGLTVDPTGAYWYVTMAHGNPYGRVYKYKTEGNELVGFAELGIFPASMQISRANGLLFCVNFNLHGKMVPSTVSVVDPVSMQELKKITTGSMPHGSRISPDGLSHFSVAMMSGELFEIDVLSLEVKRTLDLDASMKAYTSMSMSDSHADMGHEMAMDIPETMKHSQLKPTWVIPHPDGKRVYVAANGDGKVIEIDLEKWAVAQIFKTGSGPYNVELTPDGHKMVVTYKADGATGIWDLDTHKEIAVIKNSRSVSHGIAISLDSKYAFVSVEGIGSQPGSVDIISLERNQLVDVVEVGKQAGGITFWKIEK